MARLTGSTLRTVRFYEEAGLLIPDERREGGHRLFRPGAVERLQLILDLREAGLSLGEIRGLFEMRNNAPDRGSAASALQAALQQQTELMAEKINLLKRLREELAETAALVINGESETSDSAPRAAKLLWGQ